MEKVTEMSRSTCQPYSRVVLGGAELRETEISAKQKVSVSMIQY